MSHAAFLERIAASDPNVARMSAVRQSCSNFHTRSNLVSVFALFVM
jgi:hypothetical protein